MKIKINQRIFSDHPTQNFQETRASLKVVLMLV